MKMTHHLAESVRLGIADAKADLQKGEACCDHEPAQAVTSGFAAYGTFGGPLYDHVAEEAYWRYREHHQLPQTQSG